MTERRRSSAIVLVLAVACAASAVPGAARHAQPGGPRVHWLIFVDDLHLDFRGSGEVRDLLRSVGLALVLDGDLVSLASSGPSPLDLRAQAGARPLIAAAARVTGNGLKDDDVVTAGHRTVEELTHRTQTALTGAVSLVERAGPAPPAERRVLLFISRGYALDRPWGHDDSGAARLDALDVASARAGAIIVAVEPEPVPADPFMALAFPSSPFTRARRASLERLVLPSGGLMCTFTRASRTAVLTRIGALVGR